MADQPGLKVNGSNALLIAGIAALMLAIFFVIARGQFQGEGASGPIEVPTQDPVETADTTPTPQKAPAAQEPVAQENEIASDPDVSETETADGEIASDASPTDEAVDEDFSVVDARPEQDAPAELAPPLAPSFDLVRIDPNGGAVIAGTAEPGASIRLRAGDVVVAETTADASGKFVALFDLQPSNAPRSLSAEFDGATGEVIASAGTVLIAPTARPDPDPEPVAIAEAVTGDAETNASNDVNSAEAPATEETASEQVAESAPEAEVPSAPSDSQIALSESERTQEDIVIAEREAEPVSDKLVTDAPGSEEQVTLSEENPAEEQAPEPADSPAIVLADETGVKVLQPAPQPVAPKLAEDETQETVANLVIDTITYDAEGDVALSGRGAGESFARVYVDDTAVKTVPINPDGTWDAPLPEITAGIYNLRIDEVDPEGAVTSRVETPFKRETPEVVAEASTRPNAVTVQEGFTLWAIAKDRFGDGTQYVRVYEANRDLIRDPDLIYPGQIFEIPEG